MGNKLKIVEKKEYDRLKSIIGIHKYKVLSDPNDVPFNLAKGLEDKFMECVVIGSIYETEKEIVLPNRSLAPSGTLYLVRIFRKCDHDGNPHINKDDYLFYTNSSGDCFRTTPDSKDHYYSVVNASPLLTLINEVPARPNKPEGTFQEYVSHCASLDYSEMCPGLSDKGNRIIPK